MRNLIKETNWKETALFDLEQDLRYTCKAESGVVRVMRSIAGLYDITTQELNRRFVSKHKIQPEEWFILKKEAHGNQGY
jgi:hypothetical protein